MANLIEISTQDNWITEEARQLIEYLVASGMIPDMNIQDDRVREVIRKKNELLYHNTELLLRQYRDIAWQLEYAPYEIAANLDYHCNNLEELIKAFDEEFLTNNRGLEYRLKRMEHSVLMFKALNEALTVLRLKPDDGELSYRILYLTYIDPQKIPIEDIPEKLGMKRSYYYLLKKEAISTLSTRLWFPLPSRQVGMLIEAASSCK